MEIEVKNIKKKYHGVVVLDNISLKIQTGEMLALLGPSGSGKTTLLRIIAGLEYADSGTILFDGQDVENKPLKERKVGFVFQHYVLFKHLNVFENVAFGLRVKPKQDRPSEYSIKRKVMKLLKLMHLQKFHHHFPYQLSGGQRQRVALVRALAVDPKILLLDEPFGALDAKVRKELCGWVRMLHDEIQISSIFVTHDQEEAMAIADRVCIMNQGKIVQIGTPEEVWYQPKNSFVYDFISEHNVFEVWKDKNDHFHLLGSDVIQGPEKKRRPRMIEGKKIKIFTRSHELHITKTPDEKEYIPVKVIYINSTGQLIKIEMKRRNNQIIQAAISKNLFDELMIKKGDILYIRPHEINFFKVE